MFSLTHYKSKKIDNIYVYLHYDVKFVSKQQKH